MSKNTIPACVLLVDDNPAKLTALVAALAGMDLEIVTVTSGTEALRRLLAQDFAVVLLDVNMPIIDGFETATIIRSRPRSEHLPIIFITAERLGDEAKLKAYDLGAVDYILSPIQPQILRSKVAVFVDLYRLREQSYRDNQALLDKNEYIERQSLALKAVNHLKREFFANLSHELCTPLNAILEFSQRLRNGMSGSPQQQAEIELMYTTGQHLLAQINDCLSKVEADKLTILPTEINLRLLLNNSLLMLREQAAKRRIRFALNIEPELSCITADERKLRQVLYNLLANAIKFTDDGGQVSITAQRAPNDMQVKGVEIAVTDSGAGMSAQDIEGLFPPYSPPDSSPSQNITGLVTVKRLMELHGGSVSVTSELGRGSRFCIWLPVSP